MSGSDNMEREERLTTFIESMKNDQPFYLEKLQEKALSEGIPIIRPQTRGLIRFLMEVKQAAEYSGDRDCSGLFCPVHA
jgi:predicted O-methyltransferase YrrM